VLACLISLQERTQEKILRKNLVYLPLDSICYIQVRFSIDGMKNIVRNVKINIATICCHVVFPDSFPSSALVFVIAL
jgi:hypothetical protein